MTGKRKHLLDAWVQEYKDCKRGGDSLVVDGPVHDGRMHLHGAEDGDCAVTYVHPSGCVTLVMVGKYRGCMSECWRAQEGELEVWDRRRYPPPAVRVDGIHRYFTPLKGRALVGVVEAGTAVVLLGFVGGCWAVAYCEPGWSEWIIGSDRLGTIDLDLWRMMHPRPAPPPRKPPPPPDAQTLVIRRLHQLVLGKSEGDDQATEIGEVVVACLEVQVERAPQGWQRRLLDFLVALIVELGGRGLGVDPAGTKGELAEMLSRALGRPVPPGKLGESLRVAREQGCCFVALSGRRWTLRLRELVDPRSQLHRQLLEQTGRAFDLGGACRKSARGSGGSPRCGRASSGDVLVERREDGAPTAQAVAPNAEPATPPAPGATGIEGVDWVGWMSCLLIVANLYAAALDQQAAECAEIRGQAQVDHWSLKQIHERHETERQRWVADREALLAAHHETQHELAAAQAELAAVRVERDARDRELGEREAARAWFAARLELLEKATATTLDGLRRRVEQPPALDEQALVDGEPHEPPKALAAPRRQVRFAGAVATASAWAIAVLMQQGVQLCRDTGNRAGSSSATSIASPCFCVVPSWWFDSQSESPRAPTALNWPTEAEPSTRLMACTCDILGRQSVEATIGPSGSLGPRGPPVRPL